MIAAGHTELEGRVALVTGASRGLGRAFARGLAGAGAAVAVTARSPEGLRETARLIEEAGGRALALTLDVTEPGAAERAVARVEQDLGPLDLLVNNAGTGVVGWDWEVAAEDWWRTFEVNVQGAYLCARAVLPGMRARRRGRIINISSGAAHYPIPALSSYCASKAALTAWTDCLARAVHADGIRVFAYHPGMVRTALSEPLATDPEARLRVGSLFDPVLTDDAEATTERAVERFLFLASGRADLLTGRHIAVDDQEADLLGRAEAIQRDDLYTLRRVT